jgi:hypothetical protein
VNYPMISDDFFKLIEEHEEIIPEDELPQE